MAHVRPATPADADALAPVLRQEDAEEIAANVGLDPLTALKLGVFVSTSSWAIMDGELVCGLFGVSPYPHQDGAGAPWLLASDHLKRIQVPFLRQSKSYIDKMHERYPLLVNVVDARNLVHIKWLRWTGFTFIKRHERFGVAQLPFYEFVKIKP